MGTEEFRVKPQGAERPYRLFSKAANDAKAAEEVPEQVPSNQDPDNQGQTEYLPEST